MVLGESEIQSPKMREAVRLIGQLATAEKAVLIVGEPGTGKEAAARAIHAAGPRRDKPFVSFHCGERRSLPLAAAAGGTLFLNEISLLSAENQASLFSLLEGDPAAAKPRIVAATCRNLMELVGGGKFNANLYCRLNTLTFAMPPLRDCKEDLPAMARRFIESCARELGKPAPEAGPDFIEGLTRYDWPGNARELKYIVKRAVLLSSENSLGFNNLPIELQTLAGRLPGAATLTLWNSKEKEIILQVLKDEHGNKVRAARKLGMGRTTLWRKLKEYHIDDRMIA